MPVHGTDINQSQVPGREMESFYACQSRSLPYFLKVHAQIEPQNNFLVNPNVFFAANQQGRPALEISLIDDLYSKDSPLALTEQGGFQLHLLVFSFVYQFHYRIEALVFSSFENDQLRRISTSFQDHFKICLLLFLHEK